MWQVSGRSDITDFEEVVRLDKEYITNWNIGLDMMDIPERILLGLDSDTFYIYHVTAVMVDNLRRLLLGINLSDKAVMDFDFPGVGFPV